MPWVIAVAAVASAAYGASQSGKSAKAMQRAEAARQQRIKEGTASVEDAFSGYTPAFYRQREQAYKDYALPQEAAQYRDAQESLTKSLAERGVSNSSMAKKDWSSLFRQHGAAQQGIAESAVDQANALRSNILNSKQGVLGQLYSSADPGNASAQAAAVASTYQQPSAFTPLNNTFSALTNSWLTKQLVSNYNKGALFASGGQENNGTNPLASALGSSVFQNA